MELIKVQLFNTPTVYQGNTKILFPFRKAEALFFYLLVNRQASRDELVNLLWGELEEETAKKNLRNAIYKVKKVFSQEVLLSPKKSVVILNSEIKIETDLDIFNRKGNDAIAVYTGPFLKGLLVKDGAGFEEWMLLQRNQYQERYIKILYEEIEKRSDQHLPVDELALRLVETDEFDERAYRILMKSYAGTGHYSKAVELYERLCETLQHELGVQPEGITTALYTRIINDRKAAFQSENAERKAFFFGRTEEMIRLNDAFDTYQETGKTMAVMILGEAGIGKTRLKDFFLQSLDSCFCILEANCYQAEEEYLLKPWHPIFSQLSELINAKGIVLPDIWVKSVTSLFPAFAIINSSGQSISEEQQGTVNYQSAVDAVLGILAAVCRKMKLVLVFEDLQWMDSMSMQLLKSILLAGGGVNVFFTGTYRTGYEAKFDGWLTPLVKEDRLEKVHLPRFSMEEARDFARVYLPDLQLRKQQFREIYHDTEGNTFFLVEYLNNIRANDQYDKMSSKMLDILKSRFLDVSEEAMKLLNLMSLFFHRVPVDILTDLTGKEAMEILDLLSELEMKGIIREIIEPDKASVEFTHQKLREFIAAQQSGLKKRLLHAKIAEVMERKLKHDYRDMLQYSKLIHHFTEAGNSGAALTYHLKNLNIYLDHCHELFPEIISAPNKNKRTLVINNNQLQKYFQEIDKLLEHLNGRDEGNVTDKMTYTHLKGRHLIRQGEYADGVGQIKTLIKLANEESNDDFLLKGYLQLSYHCIQTHRVQEMATWLDAAEEINQKNPRYEVTGVLLRLRGLNFMMSGAYREAEEHFKKSIQYFSNNKKTSEKYIINIAACYSYLGEIKRFGRQFAEALRYYDKALAICEKTNVYKSYSFFCTCAGQAAMDLGDDDNAFYYLERAVKHYEESDLAWRRSVAEAYLSLLLIGKKQYQRALNRLETADIYAAKMKNPYESGLVLWVKVKIRMLMNGNLELSRFFQEKLDEQVCDYCLKGLASFEQLKHCYEYELIREFCTKNNDS